MARPLLAVFAIPATAAPWWRSDHWLGRRSVTPRAETIF